MRIFLILVFLAVCFPMAAFAANPSIKTTIKHYNIVGNSSKELRRNMKKHGPNGFWGYTKWWVNWSGNCRVSVKITITLPRWKNISSAPASLQKQWKKMYGLLKIHELNHGKNGIGAAKEIASSKCKNSHEIIKKWNKKDKDYDRRTRHGVKEGVRI